MLDLMDVFSMKSSPEWSRFLQWTTKELSEEECVES